MKRIKFDFNNMLSGNVGSRHGITPGEIKEISASVKDAQRHINAVLGDKASRISVGLEWARLPFQSDAFIRDLQRAGDDIANRYENVISLGIGGSFLGIKAAQDALCPPYYNDFRTPRGGRPRLYFDGNNLDPDTLGTLLANLDPKKTFVIVISKSGETTETKAAFAVTESWLKKRSGVKYGRQIFAITDPAGGALRKRVGTEQAKDAMSFRNLPVMKGVGGRFSELNIGLLHLAISGINIGEVLAGAGDMYARSTSGDIYKNPASMYAAAHTILYRKKSKDIAVLMPFSERLKSTADWYVQLLAESLGKKFGRRITRCPDGAEIWQSDKNSIKNVGRTPVSSRGTNDLHSIQQNNIEGENNKVVTFIRVENFEKDIVIPTGTDMLSGRRYSKLLLLAEEATEWALARQERPSCAINMPEINPFHWGELIFFFEMATAIEGELLGVNAFDQPGVEGYKNYMYCKLGKPGIPKDISRDITKHPLLKNPRFII